MSETRSVVARNVTAMRAGPDSRAEQVSQALFGETVRALDSEARYTLIETPDGYQGWAQFAHLEPLAADRFYPDPQRAALVTPLFLPVFRAPSGQSERITLLTVGSAVELAGGTAVGEMYPIHLPGGETGYLEGRALLIPRYPSHDTLGPNLVVVAAAWIGVPYLWGGRAPFGVDCSGFTQRVYALCGQTIPRDAWQQAQYNRFAPVERDALQAGDLIFFAGEEDPRGRGITHVGLALGEGRFLHAQGGTGVTITPLDAEPYRRQFAGARRLTASPEEASSPT